MIDFQTHNVEMPAVDFDLVRRWIVKVAETHDRIVGPLTYLFCDDPHIIEVNRQFLDHDFFTDIITFDYTRRRRISGDMVIRSIRLLQMLKCLMLTTCENSTA